MRLYDDRPSGTVARARQLRRGSSAPERRLLRALRAAFPYVKWRHQAPIGPFLADMLCLSHHLVVEVDGDTHADAVGYDARRAAAMRELGYTTLRFTEAEVMENIDGVLEQVSSCLGEREGAAQPSQDQGERPTKKGDAR
ncbi:endonuclease domain-containing protein [Sphingomonas yunnanensis]|uniref:endonuclease domain-containing protein n=1 Tax=Sphingomonas yunnanensis TaxID=310400 RepID=UPI001CA642FC|nr:endonuclease domain-containing protein [Sphingomonas yunnanensis]MBY9064314.1 endonuclease domain-containing protein [Sphingomonas yunnanensis]